MRYPDLALLAALLLALFAFTPAAGAVVPSGNLVQNPGAETGPAANNATDQPAVPNWTTTDSFTAVTYGNGGFPALEVGSAIGGDANFFAGGPGSAVSNGVQVVDIAPAAPEIDAGNLPWNLSAFIGGFSSQGDQAQVSVTFLNAAGASIAAPTTIGPVTTADRASQTTLLGRSTSGTVPAGARSARITITATRSEGNYNDGYVDNVNFTLGSAPPAPVFARSVQATPVSGRVLVRLPGARRFATLANVRTIPVGSIVDARRGRVRIRAANGRGGEAYSDFYQGQFRLLQPRAARGLVQLNLFGGRFRTCGRAGIAARKKNKSIRRLWGQGSGMFRTKGRFATATLRGTTWLTDDRCGGTLVRVTVGAVTVRDLPRRRTVSVVAPSQYLARAVRRR